MKAAGGLRALLLGVLALAAGSPALAQDSAAVAGRVEPAPVVLFDSQRDGCEEDDFPDAPARAFRDAAGTVHLLAAHVHNRQMLGPDLRHVAHDCRVVFQGRHDAHPEAHDDYGWLVAPYTLDGRTVYSLIHNEFHGNERPSLCPSRSYLRCWENSITWAVSRDGGYHFLRPPGPGAPSGQAAGPEAERCQPVGEGRLFSSLGSLGWMPQAEVFVLTMRFQPWDRPRRGELPGTYLATSKDLLDWSQPVSLMADREAGSGDMRQLYPALLDPSAPDRNFQTLGPRPLLFTVEVRPDGPPRGRRLVAREVTLGLPR